MHRGSLSFIHLIFFDTNSYVTGRLLKVTLVKQYVCFGGNTSKPQVCSSINKHQHKQGETIIDFSFC